MDIIKKYNFNQLINQQDIDKAIESIDILFEQEGHHPESPTFQTYPYLFEYQNFYKFKFSFVFSCFSYLEREPSILSMKSWCYMDYYDNWKLKNNETWHRHSDLDSTIESLSGIFYLNVPQKNNIPSTEFENQNILFEKFSWFIFPSKLLHRPGKITSNKKRYVLSADLTYED